METTKKKYQKHKTEYKLSIKHYTNSNIKEFDSKGVPIYPIYVNVTFKRKTARFRSKIKPCYVELPLSNEPAIDWTNFDYKNDDNLKYLEINVFNETLERDTRLIESIVNYQISIKKETFDIVTLPSLYHTSYHKLSFFVDWCLKQEIQETLYEINGIDIFDFNISVESLYPIIDETSALNNLEYYLSRYPNLLSLKQKYNSQTWIFDFYLGIMERSDLMGTYWQLGDEMNYYADFDIEIGVLDFKERYFQSTFLNCFQHEQFTKEVMADIEMLFIKYYDFYNQVFMK